MNPLGIWNDGEIRATGAPICLLSPAASRSRMRESRPFLGGRANSQSRRASLRPTTGPVVECEQRDSLDHCDPAKFARAGNGQRRTSLKRHFPPESVSVDGQRFIPF